MLHLLNAFPLLLINLIIYAIFVVITGSADVPAALAANVFEISIISGDILAVSLGDIFVLFAFFMMFIEVIKATNTSIVGILNHGLSAAVMVICLILLLVVQGYGNSVFLMITAMTVFELIAGFTITAVSARRDIGFAGGS